MEELVRTRAGGFSLEDSLTLAQVEQLRDQDALAEHIVPVKQILSYLPPFLCGEEHEKALRNGNVLRPEWGKCPQGFADTMMVLDENEDLIGVYEYRKATGMLHPQKMFL